MKHIGRCEIMPTVEFKITTDLKVENSDLGVISTQMPMAEWTTIYNHLNKFGYDNVKLVVVSPSTNVLKEFTYRFRTSKRNDHSYLFATKDQNFKLIVDVIG